MIVNYPELLSRVSALGFPNRSAVIAISGFGGAGKSTLAERLASDLGSASVVSGDDFSIAQQTARCDDWISIDRKRLVVQVLEPARRSDPVHYQRYDWPTDQLAEWREISNVTTLIIEGIGIIHPDLMPMFDFTVWLDTPLAVASERGRGRDKYEYGVDHDDQWRELWAPNDRDYFGRFRPDRMADVILRLEP